MNFELSENDLVIGKGITFSNAMHKLFTHAPTDVITTLAKDIRSENKKAPKNRVSIFSGYTEGGFDILQLSSKDKNQILEHKQIARDVFSRREEVNLIDVVTNFNEDGNFKSAQKYFYYPANDLLVVVEAAKDIEEMAHLCAFASTMAHKERKDLEGVIGVVENMANDKADALTDKEQALIDKAIAESKAAHDPMTGLLNKSMREEHYNSLWDEALRHNEKDKASPLGVALVLIDVDHFKDINDTYGHAAGDQILIEIANRLKSKKRPLDYQFRDGGEEFLATILTNSKEGAMQYAEHVREMIADKPFHITYLDKNGNKHERDLNLTISCGVTHVIPQKGTHVLFDELRETADIALYEAKGKHDPEGKGRNCVRAQDHIVNFSERSDPTRKKSEKTPEHA